MLYPPLPSCKSSSNIWRESKSILQLESFIGVKGNDQNLFGIKGTEETINVLNNLAKICGEGDNLKEDNLQTFLDYLKSSVEKLDTFKEQVYQIPRFFLQIENGRMPKHFVNLIQPYPRNLLLIQKLKNAYQAICPKPTPCKG